MERPGCAGVQRGRPGMKLCRQRGSWPEVNVISFAVTLVFVSTCFVKRLVLGTGDKESNIALQINYTLIKLMKKKINEGVLWQANG